MLVRSSNKIGTNSIRQPESIHDPRRRAHASEAEVRKNFGQTVAGKVIEDANMISAEVRGCLDSPPKL
jgi:hypothetical protein